MDKVTVESVTIWMLLAVITGFITYSFFRRGKIKTAIAIILPMLVFYLAFILTITIIERTPSGAPRYELDRFWSYKKILSGTTALLAENFWNVVMFVPLSVMVGIALSAGAVERKRNWIWMTIIACFLFSAGIEVVQLMTCRGLFEFDDMIHNPLGAVIGSIAVAILRQLKSDGQN